jgi:ribosome recycling factor
MVKQLEDELQKLTDKYIKDVDKIVEEKSQDILKV